MPVSVIFYGILCCLAMFSPHVSADTAAGSSDEKTGPYFEIEGNYTAAVGSDFTVTCISKVPAHLVRRSKLKNFDLFDDHIVVEEDLDKSVVLKVILRNLTYKDVDSFNCYENGSNFSKNASFNIFVDDPVHLMVGPRVTRISENFGVPVVVPCLPTAPDVAVQLLTPLGESMSFSTDPKDENKEKVYYNPTRGFVIPSKLITAYWYIYICEFNKRGVKQQKYVDVFINGGISSKFVYLERQAGVKTSVVTADVGSDVQFAAEVFTNYKPIVRWYFNQNNQSNEIVSSNRYTVDHILGEPWETRLTIRNVSEADSGLYTVRSEISKTIDFTLHVGGVHSLKIKMGKVFLLSDVHFMATCQETPDKPVQNISWSLRPYNCPVNGNCDEIVPMDINEEHSIDLNKETPTCLSRKNIILINKHILGNLTCSMKYDDNTTASVTRPLIVSEAKDGFDIVHKCRYYGGTWTVNLTCIVSRFLYSDNLYWIGSDGFVIEKNRVEDWRKMTLTKSETIYSYRLTLVMEMEMDRKLPVEEYKCMAVDYNHVPSFKSHELNLEAGNPATIFRSNMKNESRLLVAGGNLTLTCLAGGLPSPNLYWYKDETKVRNDGYQTLELHLQMNSTGRYSCRVANDYGEDYAFTDVEVYYPVPFSINETDAVKGYALIEEVPVRVTLLCTHEDAPVQDLVWYKDKERVLESSNITIRDNGTILSIFPVKDQDLGFYTCKLNKQNHKEHHINENSRSVVGPVFGSIIAILIVVAAVFVGMRIKRLRRSRVPLIYRDTLNDYNT